MFVLSDDDKLRSHILVCQKSRYFLLNVHKIDGDIVTGNITHFIWQGFRQRFVLPKIIYVIDRKMNVMWIADDLKSINSCDCFKDIIIPENVSDETIFQIMIGTHIGEK